MLIDISKKPYFMTNKEWYFYDVKSGRYKLTEKAPKKAVDSYNDFYKKLNVNELDAD